MIDSKFFGRPNRFTVKELAQLCNGQVIGDELRVVSGIATLESATEYDLIFLSNKKYTNQLHDTKACVVLIDSSSIDDVPPDITKLVVKNVMVAYSMISKKMYSNFFEPGKTFVSKYANISKTAIIGKGAHIEDFVIICDGVVIGENSTIGFGSVIHKGVTIGENAIIGDHVSIAYTNIGNCVTINSGAKIGESGFGIIQEKDKLNMIPQLGRVTIGNHVRIGANTTIDRGSICDTEIGDCTMVDNLVQIAHNVKIGRSCIIVAQVGIAGSTVLGDGVVLGGQVGVAGHLKIGNRVMAAAQTGLHTDVKDNAMLGGTPAVDLTVWKRQAIYLKQCVTRKKKEEQDS